MSLVSVGAGARAAASPANSRLYDLSAEIAFSENAGIGGRITLVELVIVHARGETNSRSITVDLPLLPGGTVKHVIRESVEIAGELQSARWQVKGAGVDAAGRPFDIPPTEVPLPIEASSPPAPDAVFAGAGDIANCSSGNPEGTARLLDRIPGTVFTLGDNVYPSGTSEQFAKCYDPSWGRHRARTRPTPGNHDWDVAAGAPYFAYYGASAGPAGRGYYSYDLGAWHIASLNSNVAAGPGSAQIEWLRADLLANPTRCTLATWHHPLFTSGRNGNNPGMRDIWRLLDEAGADLVLVGHDHIYERFAPQDANGRFDPSGLRSFVVGTGGAPLYEQRAVSPNSEVREFSTWGVLKLTLSARSYGWDFVPIDGQSFRDSGTAECVGE